MDSSRIDNVEKCLLNANSRSPLTRTLLPILVLFGLASCAFNGPNPTPTAIVPLTTPTEQTEPSPTSIPFTPTPLATNTVTLVMSPTAVNPSGTPEAKSPFKDLLSQAMTARKNGDYSRAATLFRMLLKANPDPPLAVESQYRLGEVNYLGGNYANAVTELTAFINSSPKDARLSQARFFLAQSYASQKRYSEAVAQMKLFRDSTVTLVGDADAQIGDWLASMADARGAIAQYDKALQDKNLAVATRIDILNRAAELHSKLGGPGFAASRFAAAFELATAPATRADEEYRWGLALASANSPDLAVTHWQHTLTAFPRERGAFNSLVELVNRGIPVDDLKRGLVDYYARSYDAAVSAFSASLNGDDNPTTRNFLALAYEGKGANSSALAMWDSIIGRFPGTSQAVDAAYSRGRALNALARSDEAVASYQSFAMQYSTDERADDALLNAARILSQQNRRGEAAALYAKAQQQFPNGNRAAEALWNAAMESYRSSNLKSASGSWQSLGQLYPASAQRQSSLYWLGKTATGMGDDAGAKQFWTLAASLPGGYYGWRAADQLNRSPTSSRLSFGIDASPGMRAQVEKWLVGWTPALSQTKNLSSVGPSIETSPTFRHAVELQSLDRFTEARADFETVNQSVQNDPRALYALALYYYDHDMDSLALRAARRLADISPTRDFNQLPKLIRQLIYPSAYSDLVVAEANLYSLDPALIFGLIRQESGFDPTATSTSIARGLTQVIPSTGQGIASQLGLSNYTVLDLYRPVISVHFGAYYLSQNLRSFDGNVLYALMAYNGGPGNAAKWRNDDVDLAVENITLTETAAYVRAVYAQYKQYQVLYSQ